MFDLYKSCCNYENLTKLAANLLVAKNADPVLKEISDAKSYDDRVALAEKHYKKLGEGSARAVFEINDKLVIKIATNEAGIAQNLTEADPLKQKFSIINSVYALDAKGKWIICSNNTDITIQEFKELTGMSFVAFGNAIKYKFDSETDKKPPKDYKEIESNPVFNETIQLILATDLLVGDISKLDSWCKIKNKVILRDSGLSREVFSKKYDKSGHPENSNKSYKSDSSF